jgi:hypothetical protein
MIQMSRRTRLLLTILGILLVAVSLAALAYLAWPAQSLREQAPLVPTLFVPPL